MRVPLPPPTAPSRAVALGIASFVSVHEQAVVEAQQVLIATYQLGVQLEHLRMRRHFQRKVIVRQWKGRRDKAMCLKIHAWRER
jgi:hypothetical protein